MTIRMLAAMMLAVSTLPVHAGTVEVKNCSGGPIVVYSHNDNDLALIVAYADVTIDHTKTGSIGCATDRCRLKVTYDGRYNSGWAMFSYSWGVCAWGSWVTDLNPISQCTC